MRNHLDSVMKAADSTGNTGAVFGTNAYDAYGSTTGTGTTNANFRCAGMFYHEASGLYLTQYRATCGPSFKSPSVDDDGCIDTGGGGPKIYLGPGAIKEIGGKSGTLTTQELKAMIGPNKLKH